MFQRPHSQLLTHRLKKPRAFIQVLAGLRQVDKTPLSIRQNFDENYP